MKERVLSRWLASAAMVATALVGCNNGNQNTSQSAEGEGICPDCQMCNNEFGGPEGGCHKGPKGPKGADFRECPQGREGHGPKGCMKNCSHEEGTCRCPKHRQRYLGGDISLLPSYLEQGTKFRDIEGQEVDFMEFCKANGWNSMRVRLFVDPSKASEQSKGEGVVQDIAYVTKLAQDIKKAGMSFMLDFHYSDTWADPGHQNIPAGWTDHSVGALTDSVYAHTLASLRQLVEAGAAPDLIQVGNEITNGTLWPTCKINHDEKDNWDALCSVLKAGAKACREVCPEARLILHTEKAGDWEITKRFYEEMKIHDVDYDIVGLSYYPMWHRNMGVLAATLDSLAQMEPQREVMIVETAAYYSHDNDRWSKPDTYQEFYPISPAGQRMFTRELMAELRRHPNVTGVYWWFPEENGSGKAVTDGWLNRGLFDNHTGNAMPAFYDFTWGKKPCPKRRP